MSVSLRSFDIITVEFVVYSCDGTDHFKKFTQLRLCNTF
jgi:hypothetical protein